MASSKAFNHFQHLETGSPSLPQKLQGSLDFFFVLEEDSPDLEDFPYLELDYGFESDLGGGLEELSLPIESILGFDFYFFFPLDD
jgi:hypothetical protein